MIQLLAPGLVLALVVPSAEPAVSLAGSVHDTSGAALPGASVTLDCGRDAQSVSTDVNGGFRFESAPAGRCLLLTSLQGFEPARQQFDLSRDRPVTTRVVLALQGFAWQVIVTPGFGEESTARIPQGATVISNRELRARPATILPQVLAEEPGILPQRTTTAQGTPIMRGFIGQRNVFLVDGVRLNTGAWRDGPSQYMAWIDPGLIDRIDVVRGPTSVQYGSDALGGSINMLVGRPRFTADGFRVNGSGGLTGASANTSRGGDVSVDITSPLVAIRVGGSLLEAGNVRPGGGVDSHSAVTRFLGLPSTTVYDALPNTGFTQVGGFASAQVRAGTGAVVQATLLHDQQTGAHRYDREIGGLGNYASGFSPQRLDFGYLRYVRGRTGWLDDVRATFSFNRQADGRFDQSRPGARIDAQANTTTAYGYQAHGTHVLTPRHTVTMGGEAYDEYIAGWRTLTEPRTGVQTAGRPDIPDRTRYVSGAAFTQLLSEIVPGRLTVRGGLRLAEFRFSTVEDRALLVAPEQVTTRALTFNAGAVVALTPHVNVTASLSRGFRAPNASDLGAIGVSGGAGFEISPSTAVSLGGIRGSTDGTTAVSTGEPVRSLGPEYLYATEAGLRFQWPRFSGFVTGYNLDLYDSIERRTLIFPTNVVGVVVASQEIIRQDAAGRAFVAADARPMGTRVNVNHARILGFEAEGRIRLSDRWQVRAFAGASHGREMVDGSPRRRMPPPIGGAVLRWSHGDRLWIEETLAWALAQTRLSDGDYGDPRIGAVRTRATIASFFNGTATDLGLVRNGVLASTGESVTQVQNRVLGTAAQGNLFNTNAGYVVVGARVGVALSPHVDLITIVENITDRNYRLLGSGVDEPGRNLQVRTRFRF